jgi:glycosyltransferase involved in cell wall biosynthesis
MPVSVILPNYNHARWLPQALTAISRQNPAEFIVIDDGSTDDSVSIITSFQEKFPFIHLIRHIENLGAEAAVSSALNRVRGEFLLFAAADDFILPGLLARAEMALREYPGAAFFCSRVALIDKNDAIIGLRPAMMPQSTAGFVSPAKVRTAILSSDNWFIGTSVVYRQKSLAEIGYFDRSLKTLQDAMATRLLAFRHGFCFSPEVLSAWRVIPESLSARASMSLADNEQLLAKAQNWIATNFPDDIKGEYATLFDRRMRFNFARARLVWRRGQTDVGSIADVLKLGRIDRAVLNLASYVPIVSSPLLLAWITIRVRPYGLKAIFAYVWRATANRTLRNNIAKIIRISQHNNDARAPIENW